MIAHVRVLLVAAVLFTATAAGAQTPASQPTVTPPTPAEAATPSALSPQSSVVFPEHVVYVAGKPRVVLLGMEQFPKESWAAVERHTAAELRATGLEVVRARSTAKGLKDRIGELGTQAKAHGAIGSVRVIRRGKRSAVQVWIYDAVTKKVLLREATVAKELVDHSLDLAKQVVELLNASLIEIRMRRRRPIRNIPPVVERLVASRLPAPPPPAPSRWAVTLAPAFCYAPGGARAGFGLSLAGDARIWRWLTLRVQARLPLIAQHLEFDATEATIRTFSGRLLLGVEPWRDGPWSPVFAIGAGAQVVHAEGGVDGISDQTGTMELAAQLGLTRLLAPNFRIEATIGLGIALGEPMVAFAADRRAGVGLVSLDATLGVRWTP